jgi:hypothetical protein
MEVVCFVPPLLSLFCLKECVCVGRDYVKAKWHSMMGTGISGQCVCGGYVNMSHHNSAICVTV